MTHFSSRLHSSSVEYHSKYCTVDFKKVLSYHKIFILLDTVILSQPINKSKTEGNIICINNTFYPGGEVEGYCNANTAQFVLTQPTSPGLLSQTTETVN